MTDAERVALYALMVGFALGVRTEFGRGDLAPVDDALDDATLPGTFTDEARDALIPIARRLVAAIRSEAIHAAAAGFDRVASEDERWANRACLVGEMVEGLAIANRRREAANMLRAAIRKEQADG